MRKSVYQQLIEDYYEIEDPTNHIEGFTFGRIMHILFPKIPEEEKDLYLIIRQKVSLQRLG